MSDNRIIKAALVAAVALLAASCVSSPEPRPAVRAMSFETAKVASPEYMDALDWGKVRIFIDFLDAIQGHDEFALEQKMELMDALLGDLPTNAPNGVVREVTVQDYFLDGSPLVVRVGMFTPGKDATVRNYKVLVLLANVRLSGDDRIPVKESGAFISMEDNAIVYAGLNEGLLTNMEKYADEDQASGELAGMEPFAQVMAAQAFLADQYLGNDAAVASSMSLLSADESQMPAVRIMAMLFIYDYYVSVGDVAAAKVAWDRILAFSEQVPGDIKPSTLSYINGALLPLMEHLRAAR